jgi:hypothetical protein
MPLSVDTRRIARASIVASEKEPGAYGIAYETTDGAYGADRVGTKTEAQRVANEIAKQIFNRTGSYAGAPWTAADDRDLRAGLAERQSHHEIARRLRRAEAEVRERISQLEPADVHHLSLVKS